jgi:hypothetical protein
MKLKRKSATLGVVVASVGCVALSFAPWLRDAALAWWVVGTVGFATGFAMNVRSRRRASVFALSAVAFVTSAAAAIALVGVISPARAEAAVQSSSSVTNGAARVVQLASQLDEQHAQKRASVIAAARNTGYSIRSGLEADWSAAATYSYEGADVVSVPLLGTDVPEMTKLSFVTAGGATTVTEMASAMTSSRTVHFAMWQDGQRTKNVDLTQGENAEQASSIGTYGLDWKRLNNCLNSIGISWAVIAILGVACGAACATAVLCAPCLAAAAGFTTGTIAKCVSNAWS